MNKKKKVTKYTASSFLILLCYTATGLDCWGLPMMHCFFFAFFVFSTLHLIMTYYQSLALFHSVVLSLPLPLTPKRA